MMLRRKAELHFLPCHFTERLRGVGADSKGQVCKPDYCHAPWSNQMLTIKALWKIPQKDTPLWHVGEIDIQSLKCQHRVVAFLRK